MKTNENLLSKHLSSFFAKQSRLAGEVKARFTELISDLVVELEEGHSCIPITKDEQKQIENSPLVSYDGDTPLVLFNEHLYMQRYYYYERRLATQIKGLAKGESSLENTDELLDLLFGEENQAENQQRKAGRLALDKQLAIISGGPGTGKTSTVVRIIAALLSLYGTDLKIGLAAPTGKAAMRLQESIACAIPTLPLSDELKESIAQPAFTLHRMLGVRKNSNHLRYHSENRMEWDVVIIDEASMIDLSMMSKLVDALKTGSKLILLGDKDQLASVESGSILADLTESLPENTVILQKSYRFDSNIKTMSQAINSGNVEKALSCLNSDYFENIQTCQDDKILKGYLTYMEVVKKHPDDHKKIFETFNSFRVLCATRTGRTGVNAMNRKVEQFIRKEFCLSADWYPGKPVMVLQNDYNLNLYNGDIGICFTDPEDEKPKIFFENSDSTFRGLSPLRLPEIQPAYCMTIHKSQGSEFSEVVILLPPEDNKVLSRELLYTAITRAKNKVFIAGDEQILHTAISRKTERRSGLAKMICEYVQAG